MPDVEPPPEPWRSFLSGIDRILTEPVQLHCFGGFVITQLYGVARTTSDVDFVSVMPNDWRAKLSEIGGKGSALHLKYKVYLDPVTVATPPVEYETRLRPLFPGAWKHLQLYALEAHDLALSKLERDFERDRDDVQRLAAAGHLKAEVLRSRYYEELRPYLLARPEWHDQTLRRWLEFYF